MSTCPTCGSSFEAQTQFCPIDGTILVGAVLRDPDRMIGKVIGERYRLDALLGRGAMGTVYRALHTRMDKPVAVKLLRAEAAGDGEAVARFHREARSASRLDHDNCIRVTDFGQAAEGQLYLVMEVLDGESLAALVARGALAPGRAAAIGRDVALALAHAHERGVIHRDLKADNVMLARRGGREPSLLTVKVLDFGLAKIAGDAGQGPSLTRAGSVFGTPEYMAPEQAEGLPLDERTDLYSLGVLLYQLLTGELPFRSTSYMALLAKHVEEPPKPLHERRPDLQIPAGLDALVLRCLAKAREDRPSSADEVARALAPFADAKLLLETTSAAAPNQAPPPTATVTPIPTLPMSGGAWTPLRVEPVRADPATDAEEIAAAPDVRAAALAGRPPRSFRRLLIVAPLLAAAASGMLTIALRPAPAPAPPRPDRLVEAKRFLAADDLVSADRLLVEERAAHDGASLQLLLGELAQRRGNRLGALAHLHRATKLAPRDAEPHARLATLLHRLGQDAAACDEAENALALDPRNTMASSVPCQPPRAPTH